VSICSVSVCFPWRVADGNAWTFSQASLGVVIHDYARHMDRPLSVIGFVSNNIVNAKK
jgi:hypothetical protein